MSRPERFTVPLRGLAGDGAQAIVDRALDGLAGGRSARAHPGDLLPHVEYDAERVTHAGGEARP